MRAGVDVRSRGAPFRYFLHLRHVFRDETIKQALNSQTLDHRPTAPLAEREPSCVDEPRLAVIDLNEADTLACLRQGPSNQG